jgi:hypothetical protein
MAKFFNKKEDVLDIQLTQHGKHLLSLGELNPIYYAFFDDDILYDSNYAGIDDEIQNDVQSRIEEETPAIRPQHVFSSREVAVKENNAKIQQGKEILRDRTVQQVPDRIYSLLFPLGTSDPGEDNMPAWSVKLLSGEIANPTPEKTGAHPIVKIPQLNLDPSVWETSIGKAKSGNIWSEVGMMENIADNVAWQPHLSFPDGTYLALEGEDLLLEINEENVSFTNDNFDIEVFLIEDVKQPGSETIIEKLIPLRFKKEWNEVQNGLLVEGPPIYDEQDDSSSMVDYFLTVEADSEIPRSRLCKAIPEARRRGVMQNDGDLDCSEEEIGENIDRATHGLYDPIIEDGPFGEDCD